MKQYSKEELKDFSQRLLKGDYVITIDGFRMIVQKFNRKTRNIVEVSISKNEGEGKLRNEDITEILDFCAQLDSFREVEYTVSLLSVYPTQKHINVKFIIGSERIEEGTDMFQEGAQE